MCAFREPGIQLMLSGLGRQLQTMELCLIAQGAKFENIRVTNQIEFRQEEYVLIHLMGQSASSRKQQTGEYKPGASARAKPEGANTTTSAAFSEWCSEHPAPVSI